MQVVCDILEQLLHEGVVTCYAVGGATAAGLHGEPLATRDVDVFIFIDPPEGSFVITLDPVFRRLRELGFSEFDEEGLLIHGFPVQFLSAAPGLESEAVEQSMVIEWDDHRVRVIRPEYLAAMALSVARPKDRARLVFLVELPDFNLDSFREITARHHLDNRWREWAAGLGLNVGSDSRGSD